MDGTTDLKETLAKVEAALTVIGALPFDPVWFYEVVRHGQRNMDLDVEEGFNEPEQQHGDKIAEILNAIPTLLAALRERMTENEQK